MDGLRDGLKGIVGLNERGCQIEWLRGLDFELYQVGNQPINLP